MTVICPVCKKPNPDGLQTCLHCGAVLPASAASESAAKPERPPGKEVSRGVEAAVGEPSPEAKRDPAEYLAMLAAAESRSSLPAWQLRLWGWVTIIVPLVGLVAGLVMLLRRQRGGGWLLGLALFTNAIYALFALVLLHSVAETQRSAAMLAGMKSVWQAEQIYYGLYGAYGDFEELESEEVIPSELELTVQDERNATDASGIAYSLESLTEERFVLVARRGRGGGAMRVDETGAVSSETDSADMQGNPAKPVAG